MKQPTKHTIIEKMEGLLLKKLSREDISEWAMDYIRNDEMVEITDVNV